MQEPRQFYFRLFLFWLVILLILIPISLTNVQARGILPIVPQQEKTEEIPTSEDDGRLPLRTTQPPTEQQPPPTEVIPPTHTPTIFKEATATPTFTQTAKITPSPSGTLEQETEEVPSTTATERKITESPEVGQGEPAVTESPSPEPSITETVFGADSTATSQVVGPSGPTKTPTIYPQPKEAFFSQDEILLWAGVTAGAIIIGAGLGVGIYLSNKRKKKPKPFPVSEVDCVAIRERNKKLLNDLQQSRIALEKASKEEKDKWNAYKRLLRKPVSAQDITLEDLERERKAEWERYRKEMNWVKRVKAGWKTANYTIRRFGQRLQKLNRQINELVRGQQKAKDTLYKAREQAKEGLHTASKEYKEAISKHKQLLHQLVEVFQKYSKCKDCCELKKLISDLQKEISALEKRSKQYQKDIDQAGKREQAERKAAEAAGLATGVAAQSSTPQDKQKAYDQAKRNYEASKQALKDFIDKHMHHSGITTDPKIGTSWKGHQMISLDKDGEVAAYAKDQSAEKMLILVLERGKAKLQKLIDEASQARNIFEQQQKLLRAAPTMIAQSKKKALYHHRNEADAKIEKSQAEGLRHQCQSALGDLKYLLDQLIELFKKCKKDLQNCRDNIKSLNEGLRQQRKKLEECKKKLRDYISTLKTQKRGLQKISRHVPSLKKSYDDASEALKKADECLKKLDKLPKPRYQTPGRGECGKREDCKGKLSKLRQEIQATQTALETCNNCRNNAAKKIRIINMLIADTFGEDRDINKDYCCNSRIWVGYGYGAGGIAGLGGESNRVTIFCLDKPDHYVTIVSSDWRLGLGFGGEAQFIFAMLFGPEHPDDVLKVWKNDIMGGLDFDFSVGIPFTKLAKYLWGGLKAGRVLKTLRRLRKLKAKPPNIPKASLEVVREAATTALLRSVRKTPFKILKKGASKVLLGKASQMQAKLPRGIAFPLGPALQAGVWWRFGSKIHVNEFKCCDCTSDMYRQINPKGDYQ